MTSHDINVFSGLVLDRNAEQRDDADWIAAQLADPRARFLLLGAEGHALAQRDVDALRVIVAEERTMLLPAATPSYLGADETGPFFALNAESRDAARIAHLVELAVDFASQHLKPDGALVVKLFHGSGYSDLVTLFKQTFKVVKPFKPKASRDKSSETFLVGMGLKQSA